MRIDLFGVHEGDNQIEIVSDAESLNIAEDDFSFEGPVKVSCKLRRNDNLINAAGTVSVVLILHCARCLEKFSRETNGDFSLVARKMKQGESAPETPGDSEELNEENLIFLEHDSKYIYITEIVRDALFLSVPLKSVCDENCKGLCPVCGNNLNANECRCEEKRTDPRWQSLTGFFENKEDSGN